MVDEEEEGGNGEVRTVKKQSEMLFVRGMFWNELYAVEFEPLGMRTGILIGRFPNR